MSGLQVKITVEPVWWPTIRRRVYEATFAFLELSDIISLSDDASEIEAFAQDLKNLRIAHMLIIIIPILDKMARFFSACRAFSSDWRKALFFPTASSRCAGTGRAAAQDALWKRLGSLAA